MDLARRPSRRWSRPTEESPIGKFTQCSRSQPGIRRPLLTPLPVTANPTLSVSSKQLRKWSLKNWAETTKHKSLRSKPQCTISLPEVVPKAGLDLPKGGTRNKDSERQSIMIRRIPKVGHKIGIRRAPMAPWWITTIHARWPIAHSCRLKRMRRWRVRPFIRPRFASYRNQAST